MLGHEIFGQVVKPRFDQCLGADQVEFEFWCTYPAMGRLYMSVKCSPLRTTSGQVDGVAMFLRDMTEGKLAKEALELSEQHLRLALQTARAGTWEWEIITNHVRWSDGVEALFGLPTGSFPSTYDEFLHLVHAEDLDIVKEAMRPGHPEA